MKEMTKAQKVNKNGYLVAVVDDVIAYEGYLLNGKLVILKAPMYGMKWYEGLLSEEEYMDHLMGNPLEYARRKYGEALIKHLEEFTKEVLNRLKNDVKPEDIRYVLKELDEDYIRTLLGLSDRRGPTGDPIVDSLRRIKGRLMIEGESEELKHLMRVAPKGDFLRVMVYPGYLLLIGRNNGKGFGLITSDVNSTVEFIKEWKGDTEEEGKCNMDVDAFAPVGVPFGCILKEPSGKVFFRIFQRAGRFIKPRKVITVDLPGIKKVISEYRTWVNYVEHELFRTRPPHMTFPAWKKMVLAYLDEYPNPEDFSRIIRVDVGMEFPIPKLEFTYGLAENSSKELRG